MYFISRIFFSLKVAVRSKNSQSVWWIRNCDKVAYFQLRTIQVSRIFRRAGKFISEHRELRLPICICRDAHPSVAVASGLERRIAASLRYDQSTLHVLE